MTRDARDRLDDILHAIDEIDRRLVEELPFVRETAGETAMIAA